MDWILSSSNTYCEWFGYLEFKMLIYIIADVILKVILEIASAISFHGISPNFQLRGANLHWKGIDVYDCVLKFYLLEKMKIW